MKKMTRFLALILALAMLSTAAVGAEGSNAQGVYFDPEVDVASGYTLTALAANPDYDPTVSGSEKFQTPTTRIEIIEDEEVTIHENTIAFELSFTGEADVQYVVFLLSPDCTTPIEDSIRYIDQKAGSASMSFTIYPDDITEPGTYGVYLSSSEEEDSYKKVANFTVTKPPYPMGDVDQSGAMDVGDATRLLRYLADLTTSSDVVNLDVADVDGSGGVDVGDVTKMLRVLADLDTL